MKLTVQQLFSLYDSEIINWLCALTGPGGKNPQQISFETACNIAELRVKLDRAYAMAYKAKIELFTDENSVDRCLKCQQDIPPDNPTSKAVRKCPICQVPITASNLFQKVIRTEYLEAFQKDFAPQLVGVVEIREPALTRAELKNTGISPNQIVALGPLLKENIESEIAGPREVKKTPSRLK